MKTIAKLTSYVGALVCSSIGYSQIYTHPTVGIAGEYVGSCEVATCAGTYYDNGGLLGNYSNNINQIYRVFCPSTAGMCTRLTFTTFDVEPPNVGFFGTTWYDWLTIGNGPTQNSTVFTTPPADPGTGRIAGTPITPFSYTSTDASGCLTARFRSDGSTTRPGWTATVSCVPCASGPNGTDNNDCSNAVALCSTTPVSTISTGPGIAAEGCTGATCPAGGENFSNWYRFTVNTGGTFNVTVTPTSGTDDYDFAIYGPNVTCGALGPALRCSDSGLTGVTGTQAASLDFTEDVTGDSYVAQMNVVAGQSFFLVVDKWSAGGSGFTLSFGGSATLDCTILPMELEEFGATYDPQDKGIEVKWVTSNERDSKEFILEKSLDGQSWDAFSPIEGAGNTNYLTDYYLFDPNPSVGVNYYRLKMVNQDNTFKYSEVTAVNVLTDEFDILEVFPNPVTATTELIFNTYNSEEVTITLSNSNGSVVYQETFISDKGTNRVLVDLSKNEYGIYLAQVKTSTKTHTQKIVKQ